MLENDEEGLLQARVLDLRLQAEADACGVAGSPSRGVAGSSCNQVVGLSKGHLSHLLSTVTVKSNVLRFLLLQTKP